MNSSIRSLILIAFALSASACGQFRKAPVEAVPEPQSIRPDETSALRFELMVAQEDKAFPAQAIQFAGVRDNTLDEGAQAILRDTIQLPDPASGEEIFLTWSETYKGRKISNASFVHRTVDSLNRPEGTADRIEVSFDRENRRWFIPFKRLFEGKEAHVDASTRQLLSLDLYLDGNDRVEVGLEFRVNGTMPKVRAERSEGGLPRSHAGLFSEMGMTWGAGFPVENETFTNPTGRRLSFWIRMPEGKQVTLRTRIEASHFVGRETAAPQGPYWTRYDSVVRLPLNRLLIHSRIGRDVLKAASGEWTQVTLYPFDSVSVSYLAAAVPERCSLPAPRPQEFRWRVRNGSCSPRIGGCDGTDYEMHSQTVSLTHRFIGARMEGEFEREVYIADPAIRAEDLASNDGGLSRLRLKATPVTEVRARVEEGEVSGEAAPYSCQGLF